MSFQFPFSFWKSGTRPAVSYWFNDTALNKNWNDLTNWFLDALCTIPASRLPSNGDIVTAISYFDVGPTTPVTLKEFSGNAGSTGLELANVTVTERLNIDYGYWAGVVQNINNVILDVVFNFAGVNLGIINGNSTDMAYFYGNSYNQGEVNCSATFGDTAVNYGSVYSSATFNASASNWTGANVATDYASMCYFNQSATNYGNVYASSQFSNSSKNYGSCGNETSAITYFTDTTENNGFAYSGNFNSYSSNTVSGNCTDAAFYDYACNHGYVGATCSFNSDNTLNYGQAYYSYFYYASQNTSTGQVGYAFFYASSGNFGNCSNSTYFYDNSFNQGVCDGSALFDGYSTNGGTCNGLTTFTTQGINASAGIVYNVAYFYDYSVNFGTTQNGDAYFYGNSINAGYAGNGFTSYFYNYSQNYKDFTYTGLIYNGEFNGNSINYSNIYYNATFNDASKNETTGNVYGYAYFHTEAYNYGTVGLDAELYDMCKNYGSINTSAYLYGTCENQGYIYLDGYFYEDSQNGVNGIVDHDGYFYGNAVNNGTVNGNIYYP